MTIPVAVVGYISIEARLGANIDASVQGDLQLEHRCCIVVNKWVIGKSFCSGGLPGRVGLMPEKMSGQRRRMQVFFGKDAAELEPEMMPREGIDDRVLAGFARLAEANVTEGVGERTRVLFREPGDEGMSLVHVWFKSGYVLPFHSHSVDCLYYVIGGELHMGSHVLKKGDGFFIPANQGYGYEAGPEGVEVLEFRNATNFNLVFGVNDENRWQRIADTYRERATTWAEETVPPSDRSN